MLWYPIKDLKASNAFARRLARSGIPKVLRAELTVASGAPGRLSGAGLILVNPPWRLETELNILLPALAAILSEGGPGRAYLEWLKA
jgi:23S rRNA (adenine2030-N6)-methyltransferase